MRNVLLAATAAFSVLSASAMAAPLTGEAAATNIDYFAFAGGRDAAVAAPLQAGRSAAVAGPRAFTNDDVNHAFATWGFAD